METVGENRIQPVVNDVLWISLATDNRTDVIPMGHPNGDFLTWDKELLLSGQKKLAAGKELKDIDYTKNKAKWEPVFGPPPEQLLPGDVFKALKPLFFSDQLKVGHNIKFDLKSIAKYYRGVVPKKPFFDTLMAAFVIDNRNRGKLGLKDCAEKYLKVKIEKGIGVKVEVHSFSDVAQYSGLDSEATWNLYKELAPRLTGSLARVWGLEMDVVGALCDMELAGATVDVEELTNLKKRLDIDIDDSKARAYRLAGNAFPMNSVQEKQKLLFSSKEEGGRGIKPNMKVKIALTSKGQDMAAAGEAPTINQFSVSAEALEFYRSKDELVDAILEYQDLNKLMTTYVMPYLGGDITRTTAGKSRIIEKKSLLINGKVHTSFKSHGAETGRFSSSDPNLQNIPSSGKYGKLIRNLFVAPPGYKLVVADYSQIEPRIVASFSNDPIMMDNYLNGKDIYTTIGDTVGLDRKAGKVLVLAMTYGVGPDKIAQQVGCSLESARKLLNDFSAKFHDVSKYKAKVTRLAAQRGPVPYVETVFGRRRYLPDLISSDKGLRNRADRQAFNTVIQGSAADLMKLAIVRAHSCFVDEPDVNVVLTVHDELVTVAREDLADETAEAIRLSMEGIKLPEITVPLIADVKIVDKWGEAK
ncbi:PolA DNA polymerase I - 3'-5' exonuclease and polymerase domains [uncultured Caudovirales phage]|uniref:PolA DNA polymerase I - 3'-5' exonuclease and polymerase domains n=1 Tax=uncultured Caudovirales phage TaxID=2100421 RepID=A0A6J7XJV5_9CAUD|nr:PolA DNA polymerase I - 3'-5' exonuclease and polymerase domains [uncultured Caudovirales phage]CAB4174482.1 PolA DNA polymerase I - 3'-5' exonuclease and polymerase domains [uncultured Caudovirales phage]CAB4179432.1 PolA DNA polymerase I - 3'-5' exonuclease and polymerase domains [uncultured Caudovirales phage]CAB4189149.1 PolA DNA polymerase I - 3'-5' exonuclease and polymerase domains [uncultured Caudovirales phage]CAB4193501.1 PolA DNA polymerase I - 3'-5' exonuclease and polymerase dom